MVAFSLIIDSLSYASLIVIYIIVIYSDFSYNWLPLQWQVEGMQEALSFESTK